MKAEPTLSDWARVIKESPDLMAKLEALKEGTNRAARRRMARGIRAQLRAQAKAGTLPREVQE